MNIEIGDSMVDIFLLMASWLIYGAFGYPTIFGIVLKWNGWIVIFLDATFECMYFYFNGMCISILMSEYIWKHLQVNVCWKKGIGVCIIIVMVFVLGFC